MDAYSTVETHNLLARLGAEDWSPARLFEQMHGSLSQMETRRELARQLQAVLVGDADRDYFACGLAAFVLGRFHQAYQLLSKAENSDASTYVKGLTLTRLERGTEALAHLTGALKTNPDDRKLQAAQIEALVQSGDVDEAESRLEAFEKQHPGDPDALYLQGYAKEKFGDVNGAIAIYQAVLEQDQGHSAALFRLGYSLDLTGKDDEAINAYERLREAQPTYPHAICNLGILHEDREEYDKAIRCFQWVLNSDPYNPKARLFLKDAQSSVDMYYDEEQERLEDKFNQILRTPITDFELSVRSRNCLAKMQIESLGDLVQKTEAELLSYKNFGETSLAEIKEILVSKGLHLGMSLGMDEDARQAREKAISIIFGLQKKAPPTGAPVASAGTAGGPPPDSDPGIYGKPVGDISFSMRIKRVLAHLNINTLGDLTRRSEADFLGIKNFGQTSMDELKKKIAEFGISLNKN